MSIKWSINPIFKRFNNFFVILIFNYFHIFLLSNFCVSKCDLIKPQLTIKCEISWTFATHSPIEDVPVSCCKKKRTKVEKKNGKESNSLITNTYKIIDSRLLHAHMYMFLLLSFFCLDVNVQSLTVTMMMMMKFKVQYATAKTKECTLRYTSHMQNKADRQTVRLTNVNVLTVYTRNECWVWSLVNKWFVRVYV